MPVIVELRRFKEDLSPQEIGRRAAQASGQG